MSTIYVKEGTVLPERRPHDLYCTPEAEVEQALSLVRDDFREFKDGPKRILDIGAGSGIWGHYAREYWPEATIIGAELRDTEKPEAYDYWLVGDFFGWIDRLEMAKRFDLICGNPPFGVVEKIIDRSWNLLRIPTHSAYFGRPAHGGRLGFFLRLAFLEGQNRRDNLYREHPLKKLGVYSKRVSFSGDGKTNATAHAFFLWELGYPGSEFLRLF
jgi:predicted RNA methylase